MANSGEHMPRPANEQQRGEPAAGLRIDELPPIAGAVAEHDDALRGGLRQRGDETSNVDDVTISPTDNVKPY